MIYIAEVESFEYEKETPRAAIHEGAALMTCGCLAEILGF
jgi:hypothetical protein